MPYTSMLALLEAKLQSCRGTSTSVTEKGLTVSIKPQNNEKIIFFLMDCRDARNILCITNDDLTSCDYLVFFIKAPHTTPSTETICFLELKGNKFNHAVKQIRNTHEHMKTLSKPLLERNQQPPVIISACICMRGSVSSREETRGREILKEIFGKNVRIKHGIRQKSDDIGKFLRSVSA